MRVNQGKVYGDGRERGHSRENSPEVRKRKPSLGNLDFLNIAGAWAGREFGEGGWEEVHRNQGKVWGEGRLAPQVSVPTICQAQLQVLDSLVGDLEEEAPVPKGLPKLRRECRSHTQRANIKKTGKQQQQKSTPAPRSHEVES